MTRAERKLALAYRRSAIAQAPKGPRPEPIYGKRSVGAHRRRDIPLNHADLCAWDVANTWRLEDYLFVHEILAQQAARDAARATLEQKGTA